MGIPILRFLFRKMWNTRWLTLSTFIGLLVAVSFTTSIPMYSDGSLKRVVSQSLKEENSGLPSGAVLIRHQAVGSSVPDLDALAEVDQYIQEDIPEQIGFPLHNFVKSMSIRTTRVLPVDPEKVDTSKRRQMTVMMMSGLKEHSEISNGRMYADQFQNGIIEAVVLEDSLFRNYFQVGDEFSYPVKGKDRTPLIIRVVGSIKPLAGTNPYDDYWYQGLDGLINSFMISEKVFQEDLLTKKEIPMDLANWYYNFDLREIQTSDLSSLSKILSRLDNELFKRLKDTRVDVSFLGMLNDFKSQSFQLQSLLFTLAAPMIAMVFYYIAMNSRQSLERQRSDIAVLRSRGGSTRQIIWLYLLEGLILGGAALLLGPILGWFMAKSIGSTSGFLSFVNRKSIPVDVSPTIILYGFAAVFIALAASIIPAVQYAKSSIVGLKKQLARADRKPIWQRWYLDIALIALCVYGWYLFDARQFLSLQTGLSSDQMQVQPLLFFVPALSIFSLGLFFLRIFPRLLQLFNWMGQKFLPVPLFLTLTQLSRSAKSYYPLMLLLILTLGLGVYNSSAARTIDLNSTEKVLYEYGTDVILQAVWEGHVVPEPFDPNAPGPGEGEGSPNGGFTPPPKISYVEPPFHVFSELEGVAHATRVLRTNGNSTVSGKTAGQVEVFGIDNVSFADVAWFDRLDLYPIAHPNAYLNLLGLHEQAVIVPTSYADKFNLEPGDIVNLNIQQQSLEFVVMGILPYWPSQYPKEKPFFIVNIEYIYDQVPMIPYEVWVKMEEGARVTPVVEELTKLGIHLASVKDVRIELAQQEKHPSRGGVFGILSLGFLVSVMVSLIGYILYWFFNLSSRVVQFGVLRAMGLSRKQLTGMLLLEQGFTAGLSIVLGIVIGKITSYMFLPFLQTTSNAQQQVPPFQVVFEAKDTMQLYIVVVFMMLTGAALLLMQIRRLRVHQAVKLGEER